MNVLSCFSKEIAHVLHPVFVANNWEWAIPELHIPTEDEIAKEIEARVKELAESDGTYSSTGRLSYHKSDSFTDGQCDIYVSLEMDDITYCGDGIYQAIGYKDE